MKNKITLLSLSLISTLLASSALAQVFYVSPAGDNSSGLSWESAFNEIQDALNIAARRYGTVAYDKIEIHVGAGTYYVGKMRIWSGTSLFLDDDATVIFNQDGDEPILRGSHFDEDGYPCYETERSCTHGGYSQCHDVLIDGGTWDRKSRKSDNSNIFIFRHASRITIRNMTVKNSSNHFFNLSGSKDITVSNVEFCNAVKYTGNSSDFWGKFKVGDADRYKTIEAIHLDALTQVGEPSAWPLDGTPCCNVKVVDCSFDNVFSGVGTHHVVDGTPGTGIEIRNCTFTDLQSFAVYCFSYKNALIKNNLVVGGSGLITAEGASCTATGNETQGGNHNAIQIGNGSSAVLSQNTIKNAGMAAIRLLGASTAEANGNVISNPKTMGISAAEGSVVKANGNTISSAGQHGAYVNAATATLTSNKIEKPAEAGIRGDAKAKITASGNTITDAGTYGITLGGASKLVASGNTIQNPKKYAIILDSCAASTVSGNVISGAGSVAIRLNKTNSSEVSGNTVTKTAATCDGILLDGCSSGTVSGNKVTKTGGFGIRILGTKATPATVAVTGNTVSTGAAAKGYADIRLGDYCKKCKVTGNLLANKSFTISSTGTSGNKYAPAATKLASLVRTTNVKMAIKWKKQKYATGYQLQWADNKSFKKAKTATVGKAATVSKALSGLIKKKRYWVRIRTFDTLSGKVCFSAWSPAFTALPVWAMGTFTGHAVVKGAPATATMTIANTGAVSGSIVANGAASSFAASDLSSWNGKAFTAKFAVAVGGKSWKPTFTISPSTGAQTIGLAKSSAASFSSEMAQNIALLSSSGKLAKLVGKSFSFSSSTAGAGLAGKDTLSIVFANGDMVSWRGTINGIAVSGTAPCSMATAKASGTSVVYTAKIPICIPAVGYNRLVACKATRKKSGACSAKLTFGNF